MAAEWLEDVKKKKELSVYNDGGVWKSIVPMAVRMFNSLALGVKLTEVKEKSGANIVVLASTGESSYPYYDQEFSVSFDAGLPHGKTLPMVGEIHGKLEHAVVFLPTKLQSKTNDIKVLVTVHEFIHAAGLNTNADHDPVGGIFYARFTNTNGKLLEILPDRNAKPMPPIRVGGHTRSKLMALWA
jgi:hypothetical protein